MKTKSNKKRPVVSKASRVVVTVNLNLTAGTRIPGPRLLARMLARALANDTRTFAVRVGKLTLSEPVEYRRR